MEQNIVKDGIIKVRSLKLLEQLAKNKCLGLLLWIDKEEEYPVYIFGGKPDVVNIINNFIAEHGADTKDIDSAEDWKYYNKQIFSDYSKEAVVITRNFYIAQQIIEAEFGANLVDVKNDTSTGKKMFIFLYSPEIYNIKVAGDIESKQKYENKHNQIIEV